MDPLVGRTVGGVKIEERLGSGGMASVYAGPDDETGGARRAIKLLSVASPELYQVRFDREARIGHSLTHPSCVRVHRWGVSGDYRFMVMELVEGEDLSRLLRRDGPLHWTRVAALGRDVANALQAAHDKGIVHRDLKPQNLLVDRHGRIKLADFGLSHWREGPPDLPDGASLTATGDAFGTPAYMAPEQFRDAKSAGPAADLYALGVLLFEALAGRVPFNASTPVDLARLHREVAAPSLDALAAETPEPMRRLVARLLEKEPKARPASAAVVARELEEVAVRGPTAPSSHEPGPVTDRGKAPTEPPRRRGRGPLLLVVAGLAAGVTALAATGKLQRGVRYGLATPEERARLLAIRAAREQVAKDPRAYVEALEGYLRDFGAQGWLADRVRELRDTPASLGERRWLLPVDHAEMVHVPGGSRRIGVEGGDDRTATRPRAVNVAGFLIDRVEVSNRRYERFLAEWRSAGGVHRCGDEQADHAAALPRSLAGHGQDPDGPVVSVTPWDALEYARFYGRRLPTEVEWEVAASWDPAAGAPRPWPWGDKPPSETGGRFFANLAVAGFGTVNDAGEFVPLCTTAGHFPSDVSALGVADLGGNAAEWCAGTQPLPGRQPLRGGSVLTKDPLAARAAARRDVEPKAIAPDAGFRTVTPFEGAD